MMNKEKPTLDDLRAILGKTPEVLLLQKGILENVLAYWQAYKNKPEFEINELSHALIMSHFFGGIMEVMTEVLTAAAFGSLETDKWEIFSKTCTSQFTALLESRVAHELKTVVKH